MRVGLMGVLCAVVSGCNCSPPGPEDAGMPPQPTALEWPAGAKLEVTATTADSAELTWTAALGPVTGYRLTWPNGTRETSTTTTPLRAEVAPAPKVLAPEGDISTDFCGANAFLKQGTAEIPCPLFSVVLGHVRTRDGIGVPGLRVSVLGHPEWGSTTSQVLRSALVEGRLIRLVDGHRAARSGAGHCCDGHHRGWRVRVTLDEGVRISS
jgi:hypothetical protein